MSECKTLFIISTKYIIYCLSSLICAVYPFLPNSANQVTKSAFIYSCIKGNSIKIHMRQSVSLIVWLGYCKCLRMYTTKLNTTTYLAAFGWCYAFTLDHVNVFRSQLLRLPGPYMSEEEGAEGQDRLAWLPREVWREVPQKCHQKPEVQYCHLCAWGELASREQHTITHLSSYNRMHILSSNLLQLWLLLNICSHCY